ncbi:MAG: ABC transporter ATP-binding protein [Desulfobacteraceae bacterium]|nr:ABC transporter ATP-binding protein [Desulfobacteraceae bacterium]
MIAFENVTKSFGPLVAVDGVSFAVPKGEAFALLGPNGAGKTTLVRMLLGFSRSTAGRIFIEGQPAGRSESRRKLGYLAEIHRIPPYLSGWEYLMRQAAFCGLAGVQARAAVSEMLKRVGMEGQEKKRASHYSKGMVQRIGLGAALLGDPALLVLDEPVSGLDPLGMRDVRVLLEEYKRRGGTILLNSHLLSEVERLCGSVAIMNKGRIMVQGPLAHIVQASETLEEVFIRHVEGGKANDA